ncbi:hypothetical protein SEUBUCD646_0B06260 [Saccharomyces eubayanus]|uniref:Spindle pole body component KRE28 n=2 Tax=Saccharomyces TaxID=4930 RepID=A0A6C1E4M4_SACPS|nr:spindle pole body component YDR532C [Saccharomyces pastorianus]CAI1866018.1 hypothetical protein SEUBUCD650_0B06260 [Saccharomyces eubayanus]CAI1900240.1 hypothetical protein SEUBUCD646_0B06260 [Saccharomyces eubayanus]
MENANTNDYETVLRDIEDSVAIRSEEVLDKQESRLKHTLHEITSSILAINEENEFINPYRTNGVEDIGEDESFVNPKILTSKIKELNKLMELLKLTYLEQETLDYFLRFTLSSANPLHLNSENDPQIVVLRKRVDDLKQEISDVHESKIEEIKIEIQETSHNFAVKQDSTNELYLETTADIDSCWSSLNELKYLTNYDENLSEDKDLVSKSSDSDDVVEETYVKWQNLLSLQKQEQKLTKQLKELHEVKSQMIRNGKQSKKRDGEQSTVKELEQCQSINLLIKFWEKYFLFKGPKSPIMNFEIFSQIGKIQFEIKGLLYIIVISLCDSNRLMVKDITVLQKTGGNIITNAEATIKLNDKYQNNNQMYIYQVMDDIISELTNKTK